MYYEVKMAERFANSEDPDHMPHSAASDLGLHCLPITFNGSPDYNGLTGTGIIFAYTSEYIWW